MRDRCCSWRWRALSLVRELSCILLVLNTQLRRGCQSIERTITQHYIGPEHVTIGYYTIRVTALCHEDLTRYENITAA